jgi:hypothetical protein
MVFVGQKRKRKKEKRRRKEEGGISLVCSSTNGHQNV